MFGSPSSVFSTWLDELIVLFSAHVVGMPRWATAGLITFPKWGVCPLYTLESELCTLAAPLSAPEEEEL